MSNLRNAFYGGIGFLFPTVITLITTPYIVHKLTPEIYGIYILAISLMGLLGFLDLGFGQGVIKFVSHYEARKDYNKVNKIVGVSILINGCMGIIGALLIFLLSPYLVKLFKVGAEHYYISVLSFRIVSLGFLVMLLNGIFSNILKALQRYDISVRIQNGIWFLSILSTIILLYFGKGLVEIILFYVICQILGMFIYAYFSKKILPVLRYTILFDKETFNEIFKFSIFTAINSIAGNIVFRVDKMIISYFLGTAAVAYYQIPFLTAQVANGFVSSIIQFLFPKVSQLNSIGDKDALKHIYIKATRYVIALSLFITLCLITLGKTFIGLWMGQDFALKSAYILPIIALGSFFVSISNVGYYFYNGLGKAKINMISSFVGAYLYLIASVLLISKFALLGAALAFLFILVPYPVYIFILNKLIGATQKDYIITVGKAFVIIILSMFVGQFLPLYQDITNFSLIAAVIIITSILVLFSLKLINSEDILWVKRIVIK